MTARFRCVLTRADEPSCTSYARVTITDATGDTARGCPRHALAALDGIDGARVDWAETRGLNQYERQALELAEEINARRAAPPARQSRTEPVRAARTRTGSVRGRGGATA